MSLKEKGPTLVLIGCAIRSNKVCDNLSTLSINRPPTGLFFSGDLQKHGTMDWAARGRTWIVYPRRSAVPFRAIRNIPETCG